MRLLLELIPPYAELGGDAGMQYLLLQIATLGFAVGVPSMIYLVAYASAKKRSTKLADMAMSLVSLLLVLLTSLPFHQLAVRLTYSGAYGYWPAVMEVIFTLIYFVAAKVITSQAYTCS